MLFDIAHLGPQGGLATGYWLLAAGCWLLFYSQIQCRCNFRYRGGEIQRNRSLLGPGAISVSSHVMTGLGEGGVIMPLAVLHCRYIMHASTSRDGGYGLPGQD
ncbi:hypothetical protein F5Y11DRAFT_246795 [Daldinia sp. FL1419]|nr:hypothetical protein F5Y11DRAFT_246795 [Daldinia sp. FL1419]